MPGVSGSGLTNSDVVPERGEKFKDAGFKKKLKEVNK